MDNFVLYFLKISEGVWSPIQHIDGVYVDKTLRHHISFHHFITFFVLE